MLTSFKFRETDANNNPLTLASTNMDLYNTLNPQKRQVRLFRMIRMTYTVDGLETGEPHCGIEVFSLDTIPAYKALSYCWGSDEASCPIIIDQTRFLVRPNLRAFLEQWFDTRSEHDPGWIFIDAICINQQNIDERSSQVALMGDIYRGADEVIAWLGNDEVDHGFPKSTLPEHPYHKDLQSWQWFFDALNCTLAFSAAHNLVQERAIESSNFRDRDAIEVQSIVLPLVHRPFWSRLWIVQEIMLAKRLTVWYRTLRVPWDVLQVCLEYGWSRTWKAGVDMGRGIRMFGLKSTKLDFAIDNSAVNALLILQEKSKSSDEAQGSRMLLSTAVMSFCEQECLQPVDKLYGLLGMTASVLEPDYKRQLPEVYRAALEEGIMEILYQRPDNKGAAEEVTYFVVQLARALGVDLYDDLYMVLTQGDLKHVGLPITAVSKLWAQAKLLDHSRFRKFGPLGMKAYKVMPKLYHFRATWFDPLWDISAKLSGTTRQLEKRVDREVAMSYQAIFQKRSFDRWHFDALAKAVPSLPVLTPERTESILKKITTFPDRKKAAVLAVQAMQHIQAELSRMESSRDPLTQDHARRLEGYMEILRPYTVATTPCSVEPQSSQEIAQAPTAYSRTPGGAADLKVLVRYMSQPNLGYREVGLIEDGAVRWVVLDTMFKALWKHWDDPKVQQLVKLGRNELMFEKFLSPMGYMSNGEPQASRLDGVLTSLRDLQDEAAKPIVPKPP